MDLTSGTYPTSELDLVFGPESKGLTANERAKSSTLLFVRGQVQLARSSGHAKGWRLSAHEALTTYGYEALRQVAEDGAFTLVSKPEEPAETLKQARLRLGLSTEALALRAGVTTEVVDRAERVGALSPIGDLVCISQALALDPSFLSFETGARGDGDLGVRLREMATAKDAVRFNFKSVLDLAEAGWTIHEQSKLTSALYLNARVKDQFILKDPNYSYPAFEKGYKLAEKTRDILGLKNDPIPSLRSFIEDDLQIPLVQQSMDTRFAGATLSVGKDRGIVVNISGMNENVWVRRMTLCHELGHLLWDPDQRLNKLRVDEYDQVETNVTNEKPDPVEIRANAFAVAFLAPPTAVREVVNASHNSGEALNRVTDTFGISVTAARHHIKNVCNIEVERPLRRLEPSDKWLAAENYTVDYYPISSTPISRRGRFSSIVAKCLNKELISPDTAAYYLKATPYQVWESRSDLAKL